MRESTATCYNLLQSLAQLIYAKYFSDRHLFKAILVAESADEEESEERAIGRKWREIINTIMAAALI